MLLCPNGSLLTKGGEYYRNSASETSIKATFFRQKKGATGDVAPKIYHQRRMEEFYMKKSIQPLNSEYNQILIQHLLIFKSKV